MRPVTGHNISSAWLNAMKALQDDGGKTLNLIVEVENPLEESQEVRRIFDEFVAALPGDKVPCVTTVANTIFPAALYLPHLGKGSRAHLYEMHRLGRAVGRLLPANRCGSYFDRLVDYPQTDGKTFNQLECIVERLRSQLAQHNTLSSAYELGTSAVEDFCEDPHHEMRIQLPGRDRRTRAFPCLSHISLTLLEGRLNMTAIYRNQHFISRAYGNYVGLGLLLGFISREAGCEPGTLVCVATHADAEIGNAGGLGQRAIESLVQKCEDALDREGALVGVA